MNVTEQSTEAALVHVEKTGVVELLPDVYHLGSVCQSTLQGLQKVLHKKKDLSYLYNITCLSSTLLHTNNAETVVYAFIFSFIIDCNSLFIEPP